MNSIQQIFKSVLIIFFFVASTQNVAHAQWEWKGSVKDYTEALNVFNCEYRLVAWNSRKHLGRANLFETANAYYIESSLFTLEDSSEQYIQYKFQYPNGSKGLLAHLIPGRDRPAFDTIASELDTSCILSYSNPLNEGVSVDCTYKDPSGDTRIFSSKITENKVLIQENCS